MGDRWAPSMMDALLAAIRLWSGNFAEAEELSRRALAGFRSIGDRYGMVQALAPRVRALVALGRSDEAERALEEALSLGDSYGDLAFPAMIAAGSAVHLGLGARAVAVSETAISHLAATGTNDSEAKVTLALALCQTDHADEALAVLLDVEMDFPYAFAVRALAGAMIGATDSVQEDAEAVFDDEGSSYLDRVMADIAVAAVERRCGNTDAVAERLAVARRRSLDVGDRVAEALTNAATAAMIEGSPAMVRSDHLRAGWHTVLDRLADGADLADVDR
jgi:tetratricopeptide (TPR) repeat protein